MIARYSALGLTNEQMATNPVWVDKTGNGHDLQMKNFAWKGMSGVGGYVGDFSNWVNNRDTTEIGITKSNSKVIIDVKVSQGSGKDIVYIRKSNLGISNNVTIKITSTYPEGVMKFANSASNKYLKLPSNGIITLQDNPEYTSNEMYLHLSSADLGQITIEQIPEYEGYLVTDGVDDQIISSSFEMGKDFTIVGDWEFLPIDKLNYTGIHKGNNLVLYNNSTGVILHLNQLATGIHLDIKRLNAICSDGRVYDKNWNEIVVYTPEEGVISTAKLMIGGNNNDRFTTLIFKNLGIYNNQILSKDDCIKAYNYLQTLKAK